MSWNSRYIPPSHLNWQGRPDSPSSACFFQIVNMLPLTQTIPDREIELAFGLLGFCCDEGIRRNYGRPGAVEGPAAIRSVLGKLPIQKSNIVCYDAGDIVCTDEDLESVQAALGEAVAILLAKKITPIVLGGGHELAYGHYQGIARAFNKEKLGIVNFDAHFDMRPIPQGKGTSGTPFLEIAEAERAFDKPFDYNCIGIQHAGNIRQLFETAKQYNTQIILADDLHQGYLDKCVNFIDRVLDQNQIIYVSLDLDVLAAAYAPGVSAPQALGLTPWQIIPLLRQLAASGKAISYDIAELSPPFDTDQRTAKLAASFIYEIIHHHILRR